MAHKCNAICDEEKVLKLVAEADPLAVDRYERSLLESYIEDNSKVHHVVSNPWTVGSLVTSHLLTVRDTFNGNCWRNLRLCIARLLRALLKSFMGRPQEAPIGLTYFSCESPPQLSVKYLKSVVRVATVELRASHAEKDNHKCS